MAGHNKWSKIRRQKAVTDSRRSRVWARVSRELTVAARDGGGDITMNAKLALAVQKAKGENMPKDNIERAIKRGTGEIEEQDYEEHTYEGYVQGGIAVLVEAFTDNTNRTVADLRSAFTKSGGSLAKSGSVSYLFDRKGIIRVPADGHDEMELLELVADAGADDLEQCDGTFLVITSVEAFENVRMCLEVAGISPADSSLIRLPKASVPAPHGIAAHVRALTDRLERHQDVQAVYTNMADP